MSAAVSVEIHSSPLAAVRDVLRDADEVLLGVAFVRRAGVNLVAPQLKPCGRARLVATTVFGTTTADGLQAAGEAGVDVRVLNLARGTFHPKLFVARHGDKVAAAVGSANLTNGLVVNLEAVAVLRGDRRASPLAALWELGESWWSHRDALAWTPERVAAPKEQLEPDLLDAIRASMASRAELLTLADGKSNHVREVTRDGVWVETGRSHALGRPAQLVEAWMIQIAWDYLRAHGTLTNRYLQASDGLNVKRSSFVCALLAGLPGVEVVACSPITLGFAALTQR